MTDERVMDFFRPFTVWRCILCGVILDRVIYRNRIASRGAGIEMPKFLSEESRQQWVKAVRRTKMMRKAQAAPRAADLLAVRLVESAKQAIDQAMARLEQEMAALQRAKEILSR